MRTSARYLPFACLSTTIRFHHSVPQTSNLTMLILANNQRLDHVGVDVVQLNRELARVAENAVLRALDMMGFVGRRATVAIDTPNIL